MPLTKDLADFLSSFYLLNDVIKSDFDDFYDNFSKKVNNRSTFFKFEQADFLFNSKKELIGFVEKDNFSVRINNKNNILKINGFPTIAKGNIRRKGNETVLECEISPMNLPAQIYYPIIILILLLIFLSFLSSDMPNQEKLIGLGITLFFTIIGLIIPFFTLRKGVRKLYEHLNTKL